MLAEARVRAADATCRVRFTVGDAGALDEPETTATQVWSSWDPDESPRRDGWVPMVVMAESLVEAGQLGLADVQPWWPVGQRVGSRGHFSPRLPQIPA